MQLIKDGNFNDAQKFLSRCAAILDRLIYSEDLLINMSKSDFIAFTSSLGRTDFESEIFQKILFSFGNKDANLIEMHKNSPKVYEELKEILNQPSIYDLILIHLFKKGFKIDSSSTTRDWTECYLAQESVEKVWLEVYQNTEKYREVYDFAEKLMDIDNKFN